MHTPSPQYAAGDTLHALCLPLAQGLIVLVALSVALVLGFEKGALSLFGFTFKLSKKGAKEGKEGAPVTDLSSAFGKPDKKITLVWELHGCLHAMIRATYCGAPMAARLLASHIVGKGTHVDLDTVNKLVGLLVDRIGVMAGRVDRLVVVLEGDNPFKMAKH